MTTQSALRLNPRLRHLKLKTGFEVAEKARRLEAEGKSVIHLELGEPDFTTPHAVIESAVASLRAGHTHYAPPKGIPRLRKALAEHVSRTRGIPADAGQVLVPDPGFPMYAGMSAFLGARPVAYPLRPENGFRLDPGDLRARATSESRVLILNSPHNPTGVVHSDEELRAVAALAEERDLVVISDEIYRRLVYGRDCPSLLSLPGMRERTLLATGLSKSHAMTGWRIGRALAERAGAAP